MRIGVDALIFLHEHEVAANPWLPESREAASSHEWNGSIMSSFSCMLQPSQFIPALIAIEVIHITQLKLWPDSICK